MMMIASFQEEIKPQEDEKDPTSIPIPWTIAVDAIVDGDDNEDYVFTTPEELSEAARLIKLVEGQTIIIPETMPSASGNNSK